MAIFCNATGRSNFWTTACTNLLSHVVIVLLLFLCSSSHVTYAAHSQRRITPRTRVIPVYDRSITTFDPSGRLLQVEYGLEAANRGSCIVAVVVNGTIYVGTLSSSTSTIGSASASSSSAGALSTSSSKASSTSSSSSSIPMMMVHRLDHHLFLVATGLAGDALALAGELRRTAVRHRLSNGEPSTVEELATAAASLQHALTKQPGARPLGVTALVLGIDNDDDENSSAARLYRSNPGGALEDCYYAAAGKNHDMAMRQLDRLYPEMTNRNNNKNSNESSLSPADIVKNVLTILHDATKEGTNKNKEDNRSFDIWIIRPNKNYRGRTHIVCVQDVMQSVSKADLDEALQGIKK